MQTSASCCSLAPPQFAGILIAWNGICVRFNPIVFSVEQLSSTVSEAGRNFTSDKRLGQSFYNRVDYVADKIADESEIRRGNSSRTRISLIQKVASGLLDGSEKIME